MITAMQSNTNLHTVHRTARQPLWITAATPTAEHHTQ
jgi:hypothetical protein